MLSTISVLFGGRIAEEVFMHQMTTGASNDFERATHIARDMVTRYGMTDELGPMVYAENEGEVFLGRSVTKQVNVSEETMQKVDKQIRRIIDEQYAIARKLIEDNQDKIHAMAKALLEWETIDSDQIDDIMDGKPPRPPKDWTPSTEQAGRARRRSTPRSAGGGLRPSRELHRIRAGLRPRSSLMPARQRQRMFWQTTRFAIDLGAAAGDGHRQRHARLVLRRRRSTTARRRRSRTASAWSRRAPTSSTSAASRAARARLAVGGGRSSRGCCRCCAARSRWACRSRSTPASPRSCAPRWTSGVDIVNDIRALRRPGALDAGRGTSRPAASA